MNPLQEDQRVYAAAHAAALNLGLEIIEVQVGRRNNEVFIQILADRPQGGIGMEECASLNRSIVEAIDKEGFLSEDGYSLEVSSPGLDRPLVTEKDFLRNTGRDIRVWLHEKVEGKSEHAGKIKTVAEGHLILMAGHDQRDIKIPVSRVIKGLLII